MAVAAAALGASPLAHATRAHDRSASLIRTAAPAPGFTGYFLSMNAIRHSGDVWATAIDNRPTVSRHGEIVMRRHTGKWRTVKIRGLHHGLEVNVVNGIGHAIWAGGYNADSQRYYLAHWSHGHFHAQTVSKLQRIGDVNDISASSPHDAWAVGDLDSKAGRFEKPWMAHWDGHAWARVPSPHFDIRHVDTVSPTNAWALAADGTILHWDGTTWTVVRHGVGDNTQLFDIAAGANGRVVVVGDQMNLKPGRDRGVIFQLHNGTWRKARLSSTIHVTTLRSATIAGSHAWVSGSWIPPSKQDDTVILTSTGHGWHNQHSPVHGASSLGSISAVTPHRAYAAGDYCPHETDRPCFTSTFLVLDGHTWRAASSRVG